MARCDVHCPGGSAGLAVVAVIAAGAAAFAVVRFAAEYALVLVPGAVAVAGVVFGLQWFLWRRTVLAWRTVRQTAPLSLPAAASPLAIEAPKPVVYVITSVQQGSVKET